MWPFECIGPNGQTYLHNDNWKTFLKEREVEYPHDWLHRRAILTLCQSRDRLEEVPGVTAETVIDIVEEGFSTIFQPYPCHLRTGIDPDAQDPSFNVFVEDGRMGEKVTLFSTAYWGFPGIGGKPERFAFFRGKYWRIWNVSGGGIGVVEPPAPPPAKMKQKMALRSLDDDWI